MNTDEKRFNIRSFVSLMVAFTVSGLPITGLFNHLLQTEWTTARHAWMAAHDSLGILFLIFAAWHALLNRRLLLKHWRGLALRAPLPSLETMCALAVVVITTCIAAGHAFLLQR